MAKLRGEVPKEECSVCGRDDFIVGFNGKCLPCAGPDIDYVLAGRPPPKTEQLEEVTQPESNDRVTILRQVVTHDGGNDARKVVIPASIRIVRDTLRKSGADVRLLATFELQVKRQPE